MTIEGLTDEQRERIWKRVCGEVPGARGPARPGAPAADARATASAEASPHASAPLCTVEIRVTGRRRAALMAAAHRLGMEWPAMLRRIEAACQDAAVRTICELSDGELTRGNRCDDGS